MDHDSGHQTMPAQNATQDTAGKRVQSKSPLLSLPAEIRNILNTFLDYFHKNALNRGNFIVWKEHDGSPTFFVQLVIH